MSCSQSNTLCMDTLQTGGYGLLYYVPRVSLYRCSLFPWLYVVCLGTDAGKLTRVQLPFHHESVAGS